MTVGEATLETHPVAYWIGYFAVPVIIVIVVALVIYNSATKRRSRGRGPASPTVAFSPDGRFWWNGMNWVDADASPPPGVAFTPDGRYWWDGVRWRGSPGAPLGR